jgi:uncharacterized protein YdhG (YjbR/CyaY superfamily)
MASQPARSIDEYIAACSPKVQERLQAVRATIREATPGAEERISYQMPTFALHGNLVHFAAQKNFIGFYPTSSGVEAFASELAGYEGTKGAIHFPLDQPLPLDLISRIVKFRVAENLARAEAKATKRGMVRT